MPKTILITGATGTVGSQVLNELAGKPGLRIRATVRDFMKSAQVTRPGVETVIFDYSQPDVYVHALKNVDAVFMVAPFNPLGVELSNEFIRRAKEAGVKHIVKLSVTDAVGDITVRRWHDAIDRTLKDSGIAWTILKPTGFMQNLVENSAPRPDGNIYLPMGDAKTALIDTRDIAAIAALALTAPGHEGKAYELTGPEALTYTEIAQIMREATGRYIGYVDVPESAACQAMMDAHLPDWLIDVMLELHAWVRNNGSAAVNTTVQDLLGRPARTFREFARDYAHHWKASAEGAQAEA